ncbi:hypothetical protein [Propylenella binzhouense]|uniref:Uncharacterized protein n=1 Tax=Propylenella binzhouense TaxID=2555902 RepID=A0A964T812_9HYPH|nr:hypothetical protein [Propylenella binzhouense]MYZ50218.1 hypothetical protein [Propylenella binzhouense]
MRSDVGPARMKLKHRIRDLHWRLRAAATPAAACKDALRRVIGEKRLIFCITAGRSGTETLCRRLGEVPSVGAFHEPHPDFVLAMRAAQSRPQRAADFLLKLKIPAIASCPRPVYAETSHLFGKGFLEPALALGLRPDLIMLRRDVRQIALSYLRLGTVPARTPMGRRYLLAPDDRVFLRLEHWRELSDYQLLYWYALETGARQEAYAQLATGLGCRAVFLDVGSLGERGAAHALVRALDLPSEIGTPAAEAAPIARHNQKPGKALGTLPDPEKLDALEAAVIDRLVPSPLSSSPASPWR